MEETEKFPHAITIVVTSPEAFKIDRVVSAVSKFGSVSEVRYMAGDE